ncbi:MAG: efflux RND transporter periplasmic adaptor subunit [Gammaproteobacteria bacterium]|nr:efflux RND transporter periplasmic adaptor subunit [Gammaproteobacteria bacterium]
MKIKRAIKCFCSLLLFTTTCVKAQQQPITVTTVSIGELRYLPLNSAPATTLSLNESNVSPQTPGFIRQIRVRVGDLVKQGEPLAELDCTINLSLQKQATASLRSAQAKLDLAERQIRRTKTLRAERNISEETLNQREADVEIARAELNQATAALEKREYDVRQCRINAPFTGLVLERLAAEGEWITPGQAVVQLMDTRHLEVSAQIPLNLIDSLMQAEMPELLIAGKRYRLRLRRLLPVVDRRGRNREARLDFSDSTALPGSSGRLEWHASDFHLPADILVQREGELGVMLEQNGIVRFHPLPHALEGLPAVVELPVESRVILYGRQKVVDGDAVQVTGQEPDKR